MEINGIFGMQKHLSLTMTDEQKESMSNILANYDPEDFTTQDMQSLRRDMMEAGIFNSREAMLMMRQAGFQTPTISEEDSEGSLTAAQQLEASKGELWDIYKQFQTGEITEEEFLSLVKGQVGSGSLIDYMS